MKECPVCHSSCFDDMDTCYGCMHRFEEEDLQLEEPVVPEKKESLRPEESADSGGEGVEEAAVVGKHSHAAAQESGGGAEPSGPTCEDSAPTAALLQRRSARNGRTAIRMGRPVSQGSGLIEISLQDAVSAAPVQARYQLVVSLEPFLAEA